MTGNRALYRALRIAARIVPFLPPPVAHALADFAGKVAFAVFRRPRQAVLANLAVVLDREPGDRALRQLAMEAFCTDAKNWLDTLRIARTDTAALMRSVEIDHWDLVVEAVGAGKGLVMVTIHLGNYDLVGQVIAAHGYPLTVPVERMEPPELFDFLVNLRRSKGINVVPLDRAPREVFRALRNGEIVGLAGDRLVGERGGEVVEFFGRPTVLPTGPVSLARRAGAPLLLGVGTRHPNDTFAGHVVGPIPLSTSADAARDDRENLQRLAFEMERLVRAYPGQWLNFSPMWPDGDRKRPGTMERETGAVV